jgi:hypothetical protein
MTLHVCQLLKLPADQQLPVAGKPKLLGVATSTTITRGSFAPAWRLYIGSNGSS